MESEDEKKDQDQAHDQQDKNIEDTPQPEETELDPLVWEIWAVGDFKPYTRQFNAQLEVADEVWIKQEGKGYSHVALYIGEDQIIHVSDVKKGLLPGSTEVTCDPLEEIAKNSVVGLRHTKASPKEAKIIVERAKADVNKILPYILTSENCEHQVRYWITGDANYITASTQIKDYIFLTVIGGLIGGLAGWFIAGHFISGETGAKFGGLFVGALALGLTIAGLKYLLTMLQHKSWSPCK